MNNSGDWNMRRVTAGSYYELRAKYPKASMIRQLPSGAFEGYVFGPAEVVEHPRDGS